MLLNQPQRKLGPSCAKSWHMIDQHSNSFVCTFPGLKDYIMYPVLQYTPHCTLFLWLNYLLVPFIFTKVNIKKRPAMPILLCLTEVMQDMLTDPQF